MMKLSLTLQIPTHYNNKQQQQPRGGGGGGMIDINPPTIPTLLQMQQQQ